MRAGRCRPPHRLAGMSFQNGGAAIVHAQNHRRGTAFLGDSADDCRRTRYTEA